MIRYLAKLTSRPGSDLVRLLYATKITKKAKKQLKVAAIRMPVMTSYVA